MAFPQGRPIDWPSYNNDAQRTGWEKIDSRITKDNIKDVQLVLKRKLENGTGGPNSLTPPAILGLLISYRGFKELAFVAGSSGNMWAIDVDVDRIFWQKHFDSGSKGKCAAGITSMPALIPPLNFAVRPRPATPAAPSTTATPAAPPAAAPVAEPPARPLNRATIAAGGFGAPRPLFAVSSDGKLHLMNTSTGEDASPAMPFLPANATASSLTVVDSTVYTTTTDCGNGRAAVWALDLKGPEKKAPPVAKFAINDGTASRLGGLAMANDGTVFVQADSTLYALTPKTLKLANYFTFPERAPDTTPVVFTYKDKELVASAGADGRIYLLDAKSPGGDDHKTPLFRTEPLAAGRVWGGLSSWLDTGGTRWILAPVWGDKGSIVAFKLLEQDGKPALKQGWVSRDMVSPEQPVITSGVVFALSAGERAVLYALDGTTGQEMWSTGEQVTAPANLTGLTVANGRVFFTTTDNTLYGFGIYLER
jgi:outer membrane protein assembly factor BamB